MGESLANFSMSNVLQNLSQQFQRLAQYAQTPHTSLYLLGKRNELSKLKLDIVGGVAIALYPS